MLAAHVVETFSENAADSLNPRESVSQPDSAGNEVIGSAVPGLTTITAPSSGLPRATVEINSSTPNGPHTQQR